MRLLKRCYILHHNWKSGYNNRIALPWRHNGLDSVSNHQPYHCLLSRLFGRRSKENIKAPRHWPLCWGIHRGPVNSLHKWPVTRKMFPFDDVIMALNFAKMVRQQCYRGTCKIALRFNNPNSRDLARSCSKTRPKFLPRVWWSPWEVG